MKSRPILASLPALLLLILASCDSNAPGTTTTEGNAVHFDKPPLPPAGTEPAAALKYLADSDQADRAMLDTDDMVQMVQRKSPIMDSINRRDSLRYTMVMNLHDRGLVRTPADKCNAAIVLLHSGGPGITADSASYHLSLRYFNEAADSGDSAVRKQALYFVDFAAARIDADDSTPGVRGKIWVNPK